MESAKGNKKRGAKMDRHCACRRATAARVGDLCWQVAELLCSLGSEYIYIYNLIFKYHKKLLRFETTSHRVNSELSKPSGCTVAADFCCSLCTQFPCSILAGPLASGFPLPPPLKPPHRGWPPPSSLHQTCLRAVQQMGNGAREMVRKI